MQVEKILVEGGENLALVDHEGPLVAAARLLHDSTTNLVVVCDASGTMVGVITKTDVVGRISQCTGASCTMPVAGVMTRDVVACRPEQPLSEVWTLVKAPPQAAACHRCRGKAHWGGERATGHGRAAEGSRAGGGASAGLRHVRRLPVVAAPPPTRHRNM